MGGFLSNGYMVPEKDDGQAAVYYLMCATLGMAACQSNYATMLKDGVGVEQNFGEAVRWYGKAVDQGYALAAMNLAGMHVNGLGVEKSLPTAADLLEKGEYKTDH